LVAVVQCGVESRVGAAAATFAAHEVDQGGLVGRAQSQRLRYELVALAVDVEAVIINVTRRIRVVKVKIERSNGHPGSPFLVTVSRSRCRRRTRGVGCRRGSRNIQKVALLVAGAIKFRITIPTVAHISTILPNNRSTRVVGERDAVRVLSHALYRCVAGPSVCDQVGSDTITVARRVAAPPIWWRYTVRVASDARRAVVLGAVGLASCSGLKQRLARGEIETALVVSALVTGNALFVVAVVVTGLLAGSPSRSRGVGLANVIRAV